MTNEPEQVQNIYIKLIMYLFFQLGCAQNAVLHMQLYI